MGNSTFDKLAKIAAGMAALIVCAVSWTVWVGPIPIVSERIDRLAYSLGLGVNCGSTSVKQNVMRLIEDRALGSARPTSMVLDIPSVASSGSKGDVQECRGVLSMRFSAKIAEQLASTIQSDEDLQEQVRHIWDVNKREASLPIDYEITRDTTYITGTTLFGLMPFKALVELASQYEKSDAENSIAVEKPNPSLSTETKEQESAVAAFTDDLSFSEYSAEIYQGSVIYPDFQNNAKDFSEYRTRITDAVRDGVNFAGSLTIVEIGCGTGCRFVYAVDLRTGNVYQPPFGGEETMYLWLTYKPDSSLLQAQWAGDSWEKPSCIRAFYRWTGSDFALLQKREVAGECP